MPAPTYYYAAPLVCVPCFRQEFQLNRKVTVVAATCALAAGIIGATSPVAAATKPSLKLGTKTLAVTVPSNFVAKHLAPKKLYFVLLAQPDLKHKKAIGLVGGGMTDASGKLAVSIKAPPTATCGKATLYTYQAKSSKLYKLSVTVSGCKATGQSVPPPPPPTKP